jgi:hypothetical protein
METNAAIGRRLKSSHFFSLVSKNNENFFGEHGNNQAKAEPKPPTDQHEVKRDDKKHACGQIDHGESGGFQNGKLRDEKDSAQKNQEAIFREHF